MAQGNLAHHTPTDVGIGTIRPETDRFVEIPQRLIYTSIDFLMYARARVMGSYILNGMPAHKHWNLFNDDRCTLPKNWTRML